MRDFLRELARRLGRGRFGRSPRDLPGNVRRLMHGVRERRFTYLGKEKLVSLARLALASEARGEPGIFLEAGCALGGSAILLCAAKSLARPLKVYDVFGQIPAPTDKDGADVHERYRVISSGASRGIGPDRYYGYQSNLYEIVRGNFEALGFSCEAHRVSLIQGLVQDTLLGDEPVALAHIDVDWYEPVMTCLERITPRLTPGGVIVLDDYADWSGCRRAVDEFFARPGNAEFSFDDSAGHRMVRRALGGVVRPSA